MNTVDDVLPQNATRSDLSDRQERNHRRTGPRRPNWCSKQSNSRSWSTVSDAAVK